MESSNNFPRTAAWVTRGEEETVLTTSARSSTRSTGSNREMWGMPLRHTKLRSILGCLSLDLSEDSPPGGLHPPEQRKPAAPSVCAPPSMRCSTCSGPGEWLQRFLVLRVEYW